MYVHVNLHMNHISFGRRITCTGIAPCVDNHHTDEAKVMSGSSPLPDVGLNYRVIEKWVMKNRYRYGYGAVGYYLPAYKTSSH